MVAGILWIFCGLINLFIIKYCSGTILNKINGFTLIIAGILMFIINFINLFFNNKLIECWSTGLIVISSIIYMLYKLNQYYNAEKVLRELNKK